MVIEVAGLTVSLDGRTVIRDLSLGVAAGMLTVVVGANGSGKTTLMRALAGELRYTGSIRLNGAELRGIPVADAAAMRAVVQQSTRATFPFTVHELVALGQRAGLGGDPARALEQVGLAGFGARMIDELSGGEQQRVHIARALCQVGQPIIAGRPALLLLDEPVSSLDLRHQLMVMDIARDFARNGGAVVAVLHDWNLASFYGDCLLALHDGRIAARGRPDEVVTEEVLRTVLGIVPHIGQESAMGRPYLLPRLHSSQCRD